MTSKFKFLVVSPIPTHPLVSGNRKRVFSLCEQLQSLDVEIHFAHYPSEFDWKRNIPARFEKAMQDKWDRYFTIPPTRETYVPSQHEDHELDEWWDPAIEDFLNWINRVYDYDACIVNYAWLSKTFQFLPNSVTRILDTHDRFGNRRLMLENANIKPEFFHISCDDEVRALNRADIVIGITPQDTGYFASVCNSTAITISYSEPMKPQYPIRSDGEVLKIGYIGVDSYLNRVAIGPFIDLFSEDPPAGVELVVAGSVCRFFEHNEHSNVTIMGVIGTPDEFYNVIDMVVAPIHAGTGMNIKVVEALAHGLPITGSAHAFRGIAADSDYHLFFDNRQILDFVNQVKNEDDLLEQMRDESKQVYQRHVSGVDSAISRLVRSCKPKAAILVLNKDMIQKNTLLGTECDSLVQALGNQYRVLIYCQPGAEQGPGSQEFLSVESHPGALIVENLSAISLERLLGEFRVACIWNASGTQYSDYFEGVLRVCDYTCRKLPTDVLDGPQDCQAGDIVIGQCGTGFPPGADNGRQLYQYWFAQGNKWLGNSNDFNILIASDDPENDWPVIRNLINAAQTGPGNSVVVYPAQAPQKIENLKNYQLVVFNEDARLVKRIQKPSVFIDLAPGNPQFTVLRLAVMNSGIASVVYPECKGIWKPEHCEETFLYANNPIDLMANIQALCHSESLRDDIGSRAARHFTISLSNESSFMNINRTIRQQCYRAELSE